MRIVHRNATSPVTAGGVQALSLAVSAALGFMAAPVAFGMGFVNIAPTSGIEFHQESEDQAPIGAGAAWLDIDSDGDDDLFAVQATGCNRIFINDGSGQFTEADPGNAHGSALCGEISRGLGAADYDNDGDQDLFISQRGQNRLLRNMLAETGSLSFVDETAIAGMDNDGARNSASAVWGDFNGDSYLDLYVGNHRDFTQPTLTCHADHLWQNDGNGGFVDVAPQTGIALGGDINKAGCALAATWTDYDADNDLDLLMMNDFGAVNGVPDRLFRNDGSDGSGGWLFTDVSDSSGLNYEQAGMGIAIGDLNRDGYFDYYLSDAGDNELAIGSANGTFTESAAGAGVLANDSNIYGNRGLISWGNGFFDLDRDGFEDLVVTNGGAPRSKWPDGMFGADYIDENPNYVFWNLQNSTFQEIHGLLGVSVESYFRTAAFADIDDDGDIDMHFGNLQGMNALYRNDIVNANHYLKVRAAGTVSNRDAIGTLIRIDTDGTGQMRETRAGSSFLSRNSLTAHFGLGDATTIDHVEITFPSGIMHEYLDVPADQTLEVTEPVVSGKYAQNQFSVVGGDSIPLSVTLANHDAQAQPVQLWFEHITPSGTERTLIGPRNINLPADFSFARNLNIPTTAGMAPGTHIIAVRMGTYPDTIIQQDLAFIELSAPTRQ